MKRRQVIFLDTTTVADRVFERTRKKRYIERILVGYEVQTSEFVRQQFYATFLKACILVYNDLMQTMNPYDTMRNTDDYRVFGTPGNGVKARKVLAGLLESQMEPRHMLATLRRWIERDLDRRLATTTKITDETGCCRCRPIEMDAYGQYSLKSTCNLTDPRPCRIEGFWNARKGMMTAIAEVTMEGAAAGAKKAKQACSEVLAGRPPRGQRCKVELSDAVIACESPERSKLMTTNVKDFGPILDSVNENREILGY